MGICHNEFTRIDEETTAMHLFGRGYEKMVLIDTDLVQFVKLYMWYVNTTTGQISAVTDRGRILLHRFLVEMKFKVKVNNILCEAGSFDLRTRHLRFIGRPDAEKALEK